MPVVDVVTIVLAGIGAWFLLSVAITAAWAFTVGRIRRAGQRAARSGPPPHPGAPPRQRARARAPRPRTQEDL